MTLKLLAEQQWPVCSLQVVIMSTMLLDSLENIRLRKKSPHGHRVLPEHSCLKLLLPPKFQDTYICCLRRELQFKFLGTWMMKLEPLSWACTATCLQEGHSNLNVRNGIFAFSNQFFILGVKVFVSLNCDCYISLSLTNQSSFYFTTWLLQVPPQKGSFNSFRAFKFFE